MTRTIRFLGLTIILAAGLGATVPAMESPDCELAYAMLVQGFSTWAEGILTGDSETVDLGINLVQAGIHLGTEAECWEEPY